MKSFPQGTNIFFTNPQSAGFNQAMIDILCSAEEIQTFIECKMEKSSDGSAKSAEKLGADMSHQSTDHELHALVLTDHPEWSERSESPQCFE